LTNTVGNTLNAATGTVGNTVNSASSTVGNTVSSVPSGVGSTANAAATGLGNIVNDVASGLGNIVNAATSGLGNTVNAATSGLGNTVNAVAPGLGDVTSGLGNTVNDVTSGLGKTVNDVTSGVGTIVKDVTAGLGKTVDALVKPLDPIVTPILAPLAPILTPLAPLPTLPPLTLPPLPTLAPLPTLPPLPTLAPLPTLPPWPWTLAPLPTLPPLPTLAPFPTRAPSPTQAPLPTQGPVLPPATAGPTTSAPSAKTPPPPSPSVTPTTPSSPVTTTEAPTVPSAAPVSSTSPSPSAPSSPSLPPASASPTPSTPTGPEQVTHDSIDLGDNKAYKLSLNQSTINSTGTEPATFINTKSDGKSSGTSNGNNSGSLAGSRSNGPDRNGPGSVRTVSEVGMSFGAAGAIMLVVALIMFVRRQRSKVQSEFKSDRFDPTELETARADFFETHGSHYMTGLMTSLAGTQLVTSGSSAWDDEELLVVRVPLELVIREDLISTGAFGEVYKGKFHDQEVAIKTLLPSRRKDIDEIRAFQTEIKLMAALEHPRIVKFVGVAWESLADLCVVTEYMPGGDLTSLLEDFERSGRPHGFDLDKARIALHVAHALMYLHSLQPAVIHRDLKSKNVLLDNEWNAKLTDFGVSRERADETMTSGIGSSLWMAPEMTLGERYDEKADMFSFGVLLSELDTQQLPYANARSEETDEPIPQTTVLQLVALGAMTVPVTESSRFKGLQRLVRDCVELDPKDRPTAAEALHRIHVAWTSGLDECAQRVSSCSIRMSSCSH
jgi:serine/threonine-protein kinase TNNI3K